MKKIAPILVIVALLANISVANIVRANDVEAVPSESEVVISDVVENTEEVAEETVVQEEQKEEVVAAVVSEEPEASPTPTPAPTETPVSCPEGYDPKPSNNWNPKADLNDDNKVDIVDLAIIQAQLPVSNPPIGDLNKDGNVNQADLDIVSAAYGAKVGDAKYNPAYDLDNDGEIGFAELVMVAQNFGTVTKTYDLLSKKGDANGDGIVNGDDLNILSPAYNSSVGNDNYNAKVDFNDDGKVDFDDLVTIAQNYNLSFLSNLPSADVNGDSVVDQTDLDIVKLAMDSFGPCSNRLPSLPNYYFGGGPGSTYIPTPTPVASTTEPIGKVLGATTDIASTCPKFIKNYMKMGLDNDVFEVKTLQEFLNSEMGTTIPTTGFFGKLTLGGVKAFQVKYANEVLVPWVQFGLSDGVTPTGYVFKTTLWKINSLMCPTAEIIKPHLP